MNTKLVLGLVLATALSASGAATAQTIELGPGGLRITPPGFEQPYGYDHRGFVVGPVQRHEVFRGGNWDRKVVDRGISDQQAIRIARRNGLTDVDNVRTRRATLIQVVGYDRRDNRIIVVIDRYDGQVLDVRSS